MNDVYVANARGIMTCYTRVQLNDVMVNTLHYKEIIENESLKIKRDMSKFIEGYINTLPVENSYKYDGIPYDMKLQLKLNIITDEGIEQIKRLEREIIKLREIIDKQEDPDETN